MNCPITHRDSQILKAWIGDAKSKEYRQNKGYHTGIDIVADSVYSICAGVCTYVGNSSEERNVAVIQYDHDISFRYCNLDVVAIKKGQIIEEPYTQEVGVAHDWVHFEVISTAHSNWCVRVGGRDYYKQDPLPYLNGEMDFISDWYRYDNISSDIQTQF